jgi:hypothetical protein
MLSDLHLSGLPSDLPSDLVLRFFAIFVIPV